MLYNYLCGGRGTPKQMCYSQQQTTVLLCSVSRKVGFAADYDFTGSSTTTLQGGFLLETPNMKGQLLSSTEKSITSQQLLVMVNEARSLCGEKAVRNNDFVARVKDELEGEHYETFVVQKSNDTQSENITMSMKQALRVAARESKAVRRSLVDKLEDMQAAAVPALPTSFAEALRLAADLEEQKQQLTAQIAADAPKVDFAERVGASSGILIGQFGKALGIGQNKLFTWLRANGYLISTAGTRYNTPYQKYVERGYFDLTERPYDANGEIRINFTTHITGKGQLHITERLKECGMIKGDN